MFAFSPINLVADDAPRGRAGSSLNDAIDLGEFDGTTVIRGELDDNQPDIFYKLTIGCGDCVEWERTRFDTPRKLTVSAESYGSGDELGLELRTNPNGNASGELFSEAVAANPSSDLIEMSDLGSGVYYIRLFKKAAKASFSLSIAIAPLPLHKDSGGNDWRTAKDLGILTREVVAKDFIGVTDRLDFYAFRLKTAGAVSVALEGLHQGDVVLSLLKGSASEEGAESLGYSDYDGESSEEIFVKDLPKGDYRVKVSQVSGNSDYALRLKFGESRLPDKAGDTFGRALDIGKLEKEKSFRGYLDEKNAVDIYRFRVNDAREVWISRRVFGQLSAKLEVLRLLPCDAPEGCEQVMSDSPSSTHWGSDDGTEIRYFNFMALGTGEYFIRLKRESGESPYSLTIASEPTADTAGDTIDTARRLADVDGSSSGYGFAEHIGKLDPIDLYRVEVKGSGVAAFKICGLDTAAEIELTRVTASQDTVVREPGCEERPKYGSCCQKIQAGSAAYFLKIKQSDGAAMYTISINPPQ